MDRQAHQRHRDFGIAGGTRPMIDLAHPHAARHFMHAYRYYRA